jgi:murein L,D-transpeptidase YcbB/YkuD
MRHLNAGNRAAAAASFMLWKKPPEIVSRRAIEMNLFRSGIYPAPRTTVYYADTSGRVQWSQGRRIDVTEAIRNLESASPAPAIGTEYRPVLRRGAEGEHVISLQTALNARAATLKLDGDFGPATDRAVRKFQATHGLQSDGIVGSETWGQLMTGES